jgi:putative phage-type endonuclease
VSTSDRARWLAERQHGIGASEVAAVLGLTPWESEYGLWMLKTGRRPPIEDTYVLERGRRLEAACAQWFADLTELHLTTTGSWAMRGYEHLRCSPDRFTSDGGGLECKTAGEDWAKQWTDGPALHAQAQVLWTLAVLGLPHWYLAAMTEAAFQWWRIDAVGPLADPRWRAIVPSGLAEDVIQWMVETVDNWWWDYVVGDREPDVDASDATRQALHEAYAPADLPLMQLRPEVVFPGAAALQKERRRLKAEIAEREKALQGVENRLKAGLEHALTAVDYDTDGHLREVLTWDVVAYGKPNQHRRFKEPKS